MNLWASTSGLIVVIALTFFSCEEKISTIGLDPENNLGVYYVEMPLADNLSQIWVDDIKTLGTGNIMVGSYIDPQLGLIEVSNYQEVALPVLNPGENLEGDATYDSLVLELRIKAIYGKNFDVTAQEFEVYQLAESIEIDSDTTNTSFDEIPYYNHSSHLLGQLLGEVSFTLDTASIGLMLEDAGLDETDPEDSLFIVNNFDSNGEFIYRTRIKLSDVFGQEFFDKVKNQDSEFSNAIAFSQYVKGLALVPKGGGSAIITYDATSTFSRLLLHFTQTDAETFDTEHNALVFRTSSIRSYNNIGPNKNIAWSGSDIDGLTSFYTPYNTGNDFAYLQAGTGLLLNIDLSGFRDFINEQNASGAILQYAQLVIKDIETFEGNMIPPPTIFFNLTSLDSISSQNYKVSALPVDGSGTQLLTAIYDVENNVYKAHLPLYLQSIVDDATILDQMVVTPSESTNNVNRLVVNKNNISVRVYYTLPNKSATNE